ncbi:MAG: 1-acyl-sn-glycerol-3-phosphate acyltransferase [Acidimicrobiales bacterium]|nr:1-acyl-sn-glycerol-3-phosphate acyltransferase [Acidimicrobiales bacterium]
MGQLYPVAKAIITPVFKFSWRFHIEGIGHVPTSGAAILCPNHTSVLDSFFLPAVLPRRMTYVGKAEYMDDWKTKHLFPALGMIPIDRGGGDASERALSAAQRILEAGELFGIYPEGTRSRDGVLHRGHTGPARLALRCGVPIIPVGIRGAREVMPPEARFPRMFRPVGISFGAPIHADRYAARASDHLVLRQITDEVMYAIRELSGQEYIDEYATKKKAPPPPAAADAEPVPADAPGDGPSHPADEPVPAGNGHHAARRHGLRELDDLDDPTNPRSSADVLRRPVPRQSSRQ